MNTHETSKENVVGFPRATPGNVAGNVVRGGLIGLAETVPGVSGGTVALVTGIYERLIGSAKNFTDVPKYRGKQGLTAGLRRIDWMLLIPVAIGMLAAVFTMAGPMESFVTNQPVASRSLFMGMIAMSVLVPFQEIRASDMKRPGMQGKALAVFVLFAVLTLWLTSLPSSAASSAQPPLWLVFVAASIAVCALVLPGVSGSFFLLIVGLYAPTMAAVDDRNVAYLGTFMVGALVGLVLFVRGLEWLLEHHHALTLVAMAGLLVGSLRALWPWQTDTNVMLPVGDDWPTAFGLFVVGALIVGIVAAVQRYFSKQGSMD